MYWWYPMQIKKMVWLLSFLSVSAYADLQIYPSKGLFGLDQECRQAFVHDEKNSPIACDFIQSITPDIRSQLQTSFEGALKQEFTNHIAQQIHQNTKHKTYVASLEVLRAGEYFVEKQSTTEIFTPVTLSLKLTNILTGEVLYSESLTLTQPIKVLTADLRSSVTKQQIMQQYQASVIALSSQLVKKARNDLQLSEIKTSVLDQWKSYLILDKGLNHGIGQNDELSSAEGDLIHVVYADSDYAVAMPILVNNHSKQFVKLTTNVRQAVSKPKALVVDVATTQAESKDLVEQIFSDAIGDGAAFSLVPVNKRYSSLAQSISEQTQLAQAQDINHRELPDLFIRLNILPTVAYQKPLGKITQQQVVHSEVFAEMLDRSGRVIHVAHASDEVKDVISDSMGFSLENRQEVVLKNALIKLGQEFKKGIKFTRSDLKISAKDGNQVKISDAGLRLSVGMKIYIYNQQKISGRLVSIPTWEATVISRDQNEAVAQLDAAISGRDNLSVAKGDIVLVNNSQQTAVDSTYSRAMCSFVASEQSGDLQLSAFPTLTYYAFATNSKYPFYATGGALPGQMPFQASVTYMTQNAGFKQQLNFKPFVPAKCIQPVLKSKLKMDASKCNAQDHHCKVTADFTLGVRFFDQKQQKIAAQGIQQEFNLIDSQLDNRDQLYNLQLLEIIPPLLKQVVQKADLAK